MIRILILICIVSLFACTNHSDVGNAPNINSLAEKYVRLGLVIGQYDPDFVDAYYGPDSLKPAQAKSVVFPKDSLLNEVNNLIGQLGKIAPGNDTVKIRANWIRKQLVAFGRRIKIFSGELKSFDEETKDLFDVQAPVNSEKYFQSLVHSLDSLLPGKGNVVDRFTNLSHHFLIPADKIDTVIKTALAESRKRTLQHYQLPPEENFKLEFVTNKPWGGYNWYKGHYQSVIQINTDLKIFIERAIDVASHESYPGHHVYNMLLEKNLYRDKGWVEISLYPLFSPTSLIAEGSANYGIDLAFPGSDKMNFTRDVLLPLAGMDTTGLDTYFKVLPIKGKLNYVRNEVARGLFSNSMTETEALRWLTQYGLSDEAGAAKGLSFIKKYRGYVLNYNYGLDLVRNYIQKQAGNNEEARWKAFGKLLSMEVTPQELQ